MKNMNNTTWTIRKASDYRFEETRMVYNPMTFTAILDELYNTYGEQLIINFEDCEIYIYDDYME